MRNQTSAQKAQRDAEIDELRQRLAQDEQTIPALDLATANEILQVEIDRRTAAEEALRKERDFANAVLDTAGSLILVLDREGRIVRFNRACERLTGYGFDEVAGRPFWEFLLLPEEIEPVRSTFRELLSGQFPNTFENYWVDRDGGRHLIAWANTALVDAQGEVAHLVATGIDITEGRRAEEALRASESKFRQLFDILPVGISLLDDARRVVDANPALARILRMLREELLAGAYAERRYVRPDGSPMPADEMPSARVFEEQRVIQDIEVGIVEEGKEPFWVSVGAAPFSVPGMAVALVTADITARKQAERSLFEANQRLQALMQALPVGVSFSVDPTCQRITGNPALLRQFEITAEDNISASAPDAATHGRQVHYFHNGREVTYADLPLQRAVAENRIIEPMELEVQLPSGRRWFADASGAPIRDQQGQVIGGVAVTVDVTGRKQTEEALREARDLLELRVEERTAALQEANRALEQEIAERRRAEAVAVAERERFNDVLETLPAYVVLLTPDYHATFANRVFRERFGESHGQRCFEFLFHRTTPCEGCETYRVLDTGGPHHWEWTGPDGRTYDVHDFPFTDTDGSTLILEMGIDITERKRAEQALREVNETLERRVAERTAELAASEQRFRGAIENMPDVLVIYDRDLRIQYINTATRAVTGRTPASYIGKRDDEIWPPEVCGVWLPTLRAARESGRIQYLETDLALAEGNRRALQITCVPILDEQDQVREILAVTHDRTAHKRAEETLRASEERLARAQEIAHLGSWELNLAKNQLTWSAEVYRIFGLQPQAFAATYEAFLEQVHPDDRAAVDAAYFDSVRENRDSYELEHRIVRQSTGEVRIVHEKCEHQRDSSGKVVRSIGMVHDITERKRAEELLRASEERFRGLYTSMTEGVALHEVLYDAQGQAVDYVLLDVNPAYERITGLSRAQVIGQAASVLYGTGEPPYLETYAQVAATGRPARFEAYFAPMEKYFRVSVFALAPDHFATVFDDITGRKEVERERERRAARLTTLLEISQRVLAETTISGLLQSVVDAACELIGARICIAGHGFQQGVFQVGATSRGAGIAACPSSTSFAIERGGIYVRLIEEQSPIRLTAEELEQDPDWWGLPTGHLPLRGLLGIPLFGLGGQPMGLIMASDKEQGDFTAEDEVLLSQLATVASLGVRHIEARTDAERRAGELDAVFAAIADGVVVYGLQGEIVNINAPARKLLGYGERELALPMADRVAHLSVHLADGTPLAHMEDWPPHLALQGHVVQNVALSWQTDQGKSLPMVLVSAAPLRSAEGQLLGAVATFTDVSELRAAQHQLERVNLELAYQAEKLERGNRSLRLLNRASQELGAALEMAELLDRITHAVCDVFPADASIVWLRDPHRREALVCRAASYEGMDLCTPAMHLDSGEGLAGWVSQQRQSILVDRASEDPRFRATVDVPPGFQASAILAAPMLAREEVFGVLMVARQDESGFDAESLVLVETLAAAAAIAIENIDLHRQARDAAVLGERSRLARELHDAVSQTLFSASVIAESLPRLWERKPERVRWGLEQLQQLTRGALSEMRTLLLELRPTALAEGQMPSLLQQLVDAFSSRSRVDVTLTVDSQRSYPPHVQIALYRIAQEALNNITKHARATHVEIDLRERGPQVQLLVRDNGRGFDPGNIPPDRLGLGILRERADAIDATLEITSREGAGTEVAVTWPANPEGD